MVLNSVVMSGASKVFHWADNSALMSADWKVTQKDAKMDSLWGVRWAGKLVF
jgi:hypothetical protein